jgi:hypothetical protein
MNFLTARIKKMSEYIEINECFYDDVNKLIDMENVPVDIEGLKEYIFINLYISLQGAFEGAYNILNKAGIMDSGQSLVGEFLNYSLTLNDRETYAIPIPTPSMDRCSFSSSRSENNKCKIWDNNL